MAAIQCSLGSQGQACGAVVRPAIELMLLARQLRRDFPSQIPKVRSCWPHLCNLHIVFACREMPTQTFSNKIMSEVVVAASACDCSGALSAFACISPSRLLREICIYWSINPVECLSYTCCFGQAIGPGLAGLAQGLFGKPLDKTLQCSDWGDRPLSAQQVNICHKTGLLSLA